MEKNSLKKDRHAPAHLFLTDHPYFITAGTYKKKAYFDSDDKKELLFDTICEILKEYLSELHGWVILSNHYHVLIKLKDAFILSEIIRKIYSKSAVMLNRLSKKPGRRIWYEYWDECVREEKDFYAKLNYIHFNPLKHGYVDEPRSYKFSSFNSYLGVEGKDWLEYILKHFPPVKVEKSDDF